MYEIKHNVLNPTDLMNVVSYLRGDKCPWYYKDYQVQGSKEDTEEFFSHCFYNYDKPNSDAFKVIEPVLQALDCKSLIQARANLVLNKYAQKTSVWHTDYTYPCKTAIFYINTCNGYTELKDDNEEVIKIDCEENKLLIFDSHHMHRAISQTDTKQRIVINFNYF